MAYPWVTYSINAQPDQANIFVVVSSFLKSAREEKSGSQSSNGTSFGLNMTIKMPHSKKVEVPTWVPRFALEGDFCYENKAL